MVSVHLRESPHAIEAATKELVASEVGGHGEAEILLRRREKIHDGVRIGDWMSLSLS